MLPTEQKKKIITISQGRRQSTDVNPKVTRILELPGEDVNAAIIPILHSIKVNMLEVNG